VTRRLPLLLVVSLAVLSACMPAMRISPHGRRTTVVPISAPTATGELIAVTQDSIWLMRDSTLLVFASPQVRRVQVQRHQYDAKRTMVWMAIAGGTTALALTAACGSYESSPEGGGGSCAPVFPGVLATFAIAGGLFALVNQSSSRHSFTSDQVDAMRPYARFPQGVPDSLTQRLRR
jgi:hypothetical protein